MDTAAVLDVIELRLKTISGLRAFSWPLDDPPEPCAFPGLPDGVDYTRTYQRGIDIIHLPVWLVVGKIYDRTARDAIVKYLNGSGATSIVQALQAAAPTETPAFNHLQVLRAETVPYTANGIDHAAVKFETEISGKGII